MDELRTRSVRNLLQLHAALLAELRRRGVLRTDNNPTGDLAEYLFSVAFSWKPAANSTKGFDATDENGTRYQIKARRLPAPDTSRQLSAIRSFDDFDILAVVLFDARYDVLRAALIPESVVREQSTYTAHANSHRFMLEDEIWNLAGVKDVTADLRTVAERMLK